MADDKNCKDLRIKYANLESEAAECLAAKEVLPLYRALIEHASEAILVALKNGIVFANPKAE